MLIQAHSTLKSLFDCCCCASKSKSLEHNEKLIGERRIFSIRMYMFFVSICNLYKLNQANNRFIQSENCVYWLRDSLNVYWRVSSLLKLVNRQHDNICILSCVHNRYTHRMYVFSLENTKKTQKNYIAKMRVRNKQ